jgi:addiction module HigA family antidote
MQMFNPPHPGEIIREDCIKAAGVSVTDAAAELGISRQSLSEVLNGHNGVSADMALRLENKGWGSAEGWLRNQASYDLWHARQAAKAKPRPTKAYRFDPKPDAEAPWKDFHAAGAGFRPHASGHARGAAKKSAAKRPAKKAAAKRR